MIEYVLCHRTSLKIFKKIEITPSIFSNHKDEIKINCRRKINKYVGIKQQNSKQSNT